MRHRKSGKHLGRTSSHRRAMFANLARSIILHGTIKTTLPKAKELRRVVEPLVTKAKVDSVANRRHVFSKINDKEVIGRLFAEISPQYVNRPGGYLRIVKCGFRKGDAAPMAVIQFIEPQQA